MDCIVEIFKIILLAGICEFSFSWSPKYANRTNMICPTVCHKLQDGLVKWRENCCVCNAIPSWETQPDKTQRLMLEYTRRDGSATLYRNHHDSFSYLRLYHRAGFLNRIPSNVCDFSSKLVKIELIKNEMFEIGNISCLLSLDTLDVSHNKITFIGNETFINLTNLRVLKVAYNGLKILEPSTITGHSLQLFHVDFSNNVMETVEFSNTISQQDFCKFDFSANIIKEIVNTNHFVIDRNKTYHGGAIILTGNNLTKFIDFEKIGRANITILGKVMSYGFIMSDVKWECNCHMEPYLELAEAVLNRLWRDYFNITCWNPPEYRGRSIPDMVTEGHMDLFICNLTKAQKCPKQCRCYYQPHEGQRLVVNYTNAGLTELPPYVPEGKNIHLILKNNSIKIFNNKKYLENVILLDLSNNSINSITPAAIENLQKEMYLDLSNNELKTFPRPIQTLNPCKSQFGDVILDSNCSNKWIKDWTENRRIQQCVNTSRYFCEIGGKLVKIDDASKSDICKPERSYMSIYLSIILSILSIFILVATSTLYLFRYEIYLLKRKYISRKLYHKIGCLPKFDAFISFNEDNESLRLWVLSVLSKALETSGYRIYIPCRDLPFGSVKEELILDAVVNTRNYIVIPCDDYKVGGTPWTKIEWKYIWHSFKEQLERNIIIVNFDQIEVGDEMHKQLRAFMRLGHDIDFSNINHNLMKEVKKRLGPPLIATSYNEIMNTKVCPRNLTRTANTIGRHNNGLKTLIDVESLFPNGIIGNEFQNGNDIDID